MNDQTVPLFLSLPFALCFSSICIAFGGVMFFLARRGQKISQASLNWTPIQAQVLSAQVRELVSHSGSDDTIERRTYTPEIVYSYEVNGQPFQGKRFGFEMPASPSYNKILPIVERYPVGSVVTVYYDPAKPAQSVLNRGAANTKLYTIVSIVVILLGVCCCLSTLVPLAVNLLRQQL